MSDEFDFDFNDSVESVDDSTKFKEITDKNYAEYIPTKTEFISNLFLQMSEKGLIDFPFPHNVYNNIFPEDFYNKLENQEWNLPLKEESKNRFTSLLTVNKKDEFLNKLAFEMTHQRTPTLTIQILFKQDVKVMTVTTLKYVKEKKGYFSPPTTGGEGNLIKMIIPIVRNNSKSKDSIFTSTYEQSDLYNNLEDIKTNIFKIKDINYERNSAFIYATSPASYVATEPLKEDREYLEYTITTNSSHFYEKEDEEVKNIDEDNIDEFINDNVDNDNDDDEEFKFD